jgi:CubicO group peptidase (beta-lactamase class C family)
VLEEYFYGFDRSRPHDLRSASKTFASVLVGAAAMHRAPIGPATGVYAAFQGGAPFANPDPHKQRITLGQLLTHSTGLACDDNGDAAPGNEDVMQSQRAQPDWYRYTLDLPVTHDPGEHYAYCSATMNLAGGVVAAVEHAWLPALFDQWVAVPLQFQRYYVNLMPTGQAYFGGGMQLVPRDLLKLGVAYLQGGLWNGRRIVTRAWVDQSTAQQVGPPGDADADGFGWHRHPLTIGGRTFREYEANGNGGQFLIVLPELDLAVVFTGGDYQRYGIWRRWRDVLVPQYVIAAVADTPALAAPSVRPSY